MYISPSFLIQGLHWCCICHLLHGKRPLTSCTLLTTFNTSTLVLKWACHVGCKAYKRRQAYYPMNVWRQKNQQRTQNHTPLLMKLMISMKVQTQIWWVNFINLNVWYYWHRDCFIRVRMGVTEPITPLVDSRYSGIKIKSYVQLVCQSSIAFLGISKPWATVYVVSSIFLCFWVIFIAYNYDIYLNTLHDNVNSCFLLELIKPIFDIIMYHRNQKINTTLYAD